MQKDRIAKTRHEPPPIDQPNVFPLNWNNRTVKLDEVWSLTTHHNFSSISG